MKFNVYLNAKVQEAKECKNGSVMVTFEIPSIQNQKKVISFISKDKYNEYFEKLNENDKVKVYGILYKRKSEKTNSWEWYLEFINLDINDNKKEYILLSIKPLSYVIRNTNSKPYISITYKDNDRERRQNLSPHYNDKFDTNLKRLQDKLDIYIKDNLTMILCFKTFVINNFLNVFFVEED